MKDFLHAQDTKQNLKDQHIATSPKLAGACAWVMPIGPASPVLHEILGSVGSLYLLRSREPTLPSLSVGFRNSRGKTTNRNHMSDSKKNKKSSWNCEVAQLVLSNSFSVSSQG